MCSHPRATYYSMAEGRVAPEALEAASPPPVTAASAASAGGARGAGGAGGADFAAGAATGGAELSAISSIELCRLCRLEELLEVGCLPSPEPPPLKLRKEVVLVGFLSPLGGWLAAPLRLRDDGVATTAPRRPLGVGAGGMAGGGSGRS